MLSVRTNAIQDRGGHLVKPSLAKGFAFGLALSIPAWGILAGIAYALLRALTALMAALELD